MLLNFLIASMIINSKIIRVYYIITLLYITFIVFIISISINFNLTINLVLFLFPFLI